MRISDWSSDVCSSDLQLKAHEMNNAPVVTSLAGTLPKALLPRPAMTAASNGRKTINTIRSEEHTSELQSLMRISYAVFCLKKKNQKTPIRKKQQHLNKTTTERWRNKKQRKRMKTSMIK